ncbi:hypothetical protein [Chryseobacterium sp.]|uniref:hypothetical protein n=1 Tax=Chryseobacterium sp. TaxID=1871047 RepID=UPI0025BC0684|nr:hypothetical protein [Chryseobacterium sp.]
MKKFILIITCFIFQAAFSQQTEIFKIRKYRVNYLNDRIEESSGLNFFEGNLYTFNDSGNAPEIYKIDPLSGDILETLKVPAKNIDWEALTNDGVNFYIGDFGNNAGTRKDLKIYKVPFTAFDSIKTISFFYPEQKDFTSKNINNDFDAEAMIYLNGKIHVFTKEWASRATSHYIIDPEIYLEQPAEKTESYKTNFVVTDASYFNKKLYLIGYTKKTEVFLDIFSETEPGVFFKETPKHYYLGSALGIGQIEGIAVNDDGIYISGEKFHSPLGNTRPSLYFIPKEQFNP